MTYARTDQPVALKRRIAAARAGEHGLGFAGVAVKSRKLADQSTQSTNEPTGTPRVPDSKASSVKSARSIVENMENSTRLVAVKDLSSGNDLGQPPPKNFRRRHPRGSTTFSRRRRGTNERSVGCDLRRSDQGHDTAPREHHRGDVSYPTVEEQASAQRSTRASRRPRNDKRANSLQRGLSSTDAIPPPANSCQLSRKTASTRWIVSSSDSAIQPRREQRDTRRNGVLRLPRNHVRPRLRRSTATCRRTATFMEKELTHIRPDFYRDSEVETKWSLHASTVRSGKLSRSRHSPPFQRGRTSSSGR